MSFLHKPESGGYNTDNGKFNEATMLVSETAEELVEAYTYLVRLQPVVDELQQQNLLPGWNRHDEEVIPGVAHNIGPIHRGARFKNITEYQLMKLLRAIAKVEIALAKLDIESRDLPEYFTPRNANEADPQLSRQLVKRLNDIRRDAVAEQEELLQNPDLITDKIKPFREIWNWYHKKMKNKKKPGNNPRLMLFN